MMVSESPSIMDAFKAFGAYEHTGSSHIDQVFSEARMALDSLPVPTRRTEAWKYTPISKLLKTEWQPTKEAAPFNIASLDLPHLDALKVWVLDGEVLIEDAEMPDGLTLLSMSEAKTIEQEQFETVYGQQADHKNELFVSLNTAFASGGVYVRLAKNTVLERPIHIAHVYSQQGTAVMTRNIFIAETGSKGHITQSFYHTEGELHSNSVSELRVEDNASLTLDKLQEGTDQSYHYSSEEVAQGRDSEFTLNTITLSGGWTRNDPHIKFKGTNSVCHLNGAYAPSRKDLIDNHSVIDHLVPHCVSHELYKGVIYDSGKGVFNGKVFVRPDAQKTNAYQQNANIVMSDKGIMNSKPELEIYADDVKCSHGSTTGQLDMDALFYLKCRGLSHQNAKKMLVNAFVGEVVERLSPDLQDWVWSKLDNGH